MPLLRPPFYAQENGSSTSSLMERLKGMQELADQSHVTTLTLVKSIQEGMSEGFTRVREDINGLREGQQELLQRVDELESKTS